MKLYLPLLGVISPLFWFMSCTTIAVQKTPIVETLSVEASAHQYTLEPDYTFTQKERDAEALVESKIQETLFSQCFEDIILHKRSRLLRTNGRSREEVLRHLRESKATVKVTLYYKNNNVIGYRNTGSTTIHANRKFFNGATPCSKASNRMHEITHVLGYGHEFNYTPLRPFSVPYGVGFAVKECCK